jgi:hypothetical protein
MIPTIVTAGIVLTVVMTAPPASAGFTPGQHGDARGGTLRGKVRLSGATGGGGPVEGGPPARRA